MILHFLNDIVNDIESTWKVIITSKLLVRRVPDKEDTRFMSFDIKITRLGFEIACRQAS